MFLKLFKSHCLSINVMSLQVWCYECDEYVEGWDVLDFIRGGDEDEEIDVVNVPNPMNGRMSISSGSGEFKSSSISQCIHIIMEIFVIKSRPFSVGLYNSGNSCFINAALQILLNCPTLVGFFRENCASFVVNRERTHPPQPSISDQFMALIGAIKSPEW